MHVTISSPQGDTHAAHPRVADELSFAYDAQAGWFRVRAAGFWTVALIDRHFAELGNAITRHRFGGGVVSALVDLSDATVQSADVAARVQAGTSATYRNGDRIAVLLGSVLTKAQMRRVLDPAIFELFTSRDDAEAWLGRRA